MREPLGDRNCKEEKVLKTTSTIYALIFSLLFTCIFSSASAQEPEIVVTGHGSASLMPDRATIEFSITTRAKTSSDAANNNIVIYSKIVDALSKEGYSKQEIFTSKYKVDPYYDRSEKRKHLGYTALHVFHIYQNDFERIGILVDTLLDAGATNVNKIKFFSSKVDSLRQVALAKAVKTAQADAEAMANAAGGALGSLIKLTTQIDERRRDPDIQAIALVSGVERSTSITPNKLIVKARVLGYWKFREPEEQ